MSTELKKFFYPTTIAVVGASTKEKSIGYELLKTINNYNYKGKLFPVNPKADYILDYKCYKSISDIEDKIDLAILVVPKAFVEESIDQLLIKETKAIILITAGFKETGTEGAELEKQIAEKIKNSGGRMVGPNCMGIINTLEDIKLNATFVAEKPEIGNFGFLSQSGALGAAVLNSLRETDIKFAHFISVGNKADINENDILHFWQEDENIKTLTFYLESFVDGENFIKPFLNGEITKPSIVLKAGRTSSGMKAASSHTGALSSKDKVVDALLKQFGIIRADNLNELFNTAKGFENFPTPAGNKIAIITNAGGPAILAVDALEKENLKLAEFDEASKNKLKEIVHPEGSVENPVDLLPGGSAEIYKRAVEIAIEDSGVDAVISIFVEPVMVQPIGVVESINSIVSDKPVFQVVMPLPEFWENYRNNSSSKIPIFKNPEDPAEIISNMIFHSNTQARLFKYKKDYKYFSGLKSKNIIQNEKGFISKISIDNICSEYNIPVIKDRLIKPEQLKDVNDFEYPIVLKAISKNVIHKSELNAVRLNIQNRDSLIRNAEEIISDFKLSGNRVEEFLIQPFLKTKHEILLGGVRDTSFGPIIMFGTGGKYVETISDTAIRSAYLSQYDIDEMISSTAIGKILSGVRGEKPFDLGLLKKIIKSSAQMLIENSCIHEFDFNPLIITDNDEIHAVDIRIKIN